MISLKDTDDVSVNARTSCAKATLPIEFAKEEGLERVYGSTYDHDERRPTGGNESAMAVVFEDGQPVIDLVDPLCNRDSP
jgi:hypothetical protein